MQTLEALLEKKIPDDYMKNYKKTIHSKLQNSPDTVRSESNGCDQPLQNGDNIVISPLDSLVSPSPVVKTMPLAALSSNGVAGHGSFKLVPSPEGGIAQLKSGVLQIRAVGANNRIVGTHNRRILPATNGDLEETLRLLAPSSNGDGRKKFKITTVPKMVPLINTVGNQSKLLPFQASEVSPQLKPSLKLSSILEARLSSKQVAGPSSISSRDPESISLSKNNSVSESQESLILDASTTTLEKVPQNQGYTVQRNRKTTISFERGATRIVSTKAKNTQTVDIGVQVYMPDPEEDLEGNQVHLPNPIPPLQPISSTAGPMHPATSISTLPQSEYVIVDTKNGKRILSIPKQMAGTKTTFVIDGKIASISQPSNSSVTSSKSILLSDPHLGQNRSNLVTAASLTCDTVTTPSISTPLQVPSSNSFILSVPTPTGASRSMQTVIGSSALSFNHKVPSDRLVLPLNSPVTFEGKLSSMDSPADSVASSQSRFQITANSDSIVLPLNSPIKSSNIRRQNNSEICTIPNTTSLFIMVPNDRNLATSLDEAGEAISSSNILKRKAAVLKNDFPSLKKRCPELLKSSSDTVEACEKGGVQQHRNGQIHTSPDSALNSNEFSAPTSKEDINCLVKNAFLEFRNCLVPDKDGKLPIHLAVENNDLAAVKRQCIVLKARRSSIDIPTSKDESPLQLALYHGHCSIAALLLQHGADASITDQEGNTALHLAVMHAEDIFESVFLSRQYTIEFVNNLNDEGFAALHLAAQQDKIIAIQWLINHGAEVDLPDGTCGRTALFLAIERKSYRAQNALLASGADMREPTFSGSTPFHLTKADTIAHLTSGQDAVAEFIDSDALLRSPRSSSPSEEN